MRQLIRATLLVCLLSIGSAMAQTRAEVDRNKAKAKAFIDLAFNQKKPAEAVKKYMGSYYTQHNPMAPDGGEAFTQFVSSFTKQFPNLKYVIHRVIGDGDLVAIHANVISTPGTKGMAVVDILRFENGKIVEHWDVVQQVPEKAANPNGMFGGKGGA